MLDRLALRLVSPFTGWGARRLCALGCRADQVTLMGFGFGLAGAALIALQHPLIALMLLALSRIADGLDGALARLCGPTDRGAFLDIALDFLFYAAVPLGFALADPAANALAAAVLLAAFMGTGTTFLAFSALAAKRGLPSKDYPTKGIYYLGGLTEGTETLACFAAMCLWPQHFAALAYLYSALCAVTTVTRLVSGWRMFTGENS